MNFPLDSPGGRPTAQLPPIGHQGHELVRAPGEDQWIGWENLHRKTHEISGVPVFYVPLEPIPEGNVAVHDDLGNSGHD